MINQQVSPKNYIERIVNMMKRKQNRVVKVDVKKVANADITQTKEFWANAVIS